MPSFAQSYRRFLIIYPVVALLFHGAVAHGQSELLEQRWFELETEHFTIVSQSSARQTNRFAEQLESWRLLVAKVVSEQDSYPQAQVPNFVFLFDDEESFANFQRAQETAFFIQTPRANYMALTRGNEDSLLEAKHYYAHFLIRNFEDLRLPRWYEEGLAGYLSRIQFRRGDPEFQEFSRDSNMQMAELGTELSMERLLYRDDALASPRLIQIANLKSVALLHYLFHAANRGYPDHKENLSTYLQHILEGRSERFAFDMGFPVTTEQLDDELLEYLISGASDTDDVVDELEVVLPEFSVNEMSTAEVATMLGELGLNAGSPSHSEFYFRFLLENGHESARSYSGLGDALRFRALQEEIEESDQVIADYFSEAVNLAPDDPSILMDYGEYWEAELHNCEKSYPANQRLLTIADIESHFEKAYSLNPNNAEANLAMGQLYLFENKDWQMGQAYQVRAFELLPADSFIMEQSIKYLLKAGDYAQAEQLIDELAQPIHMFGEPDYVSALRERLVSAQNNLAYDECAE